MPIPHVRVAAAKSMPPARCHGRDAPLPAPGATAPRTAAPGARVGTDPAPTRIPADPDIRASCLLGSAAACCRAAVTHSKRGEMSG
jgi:hypothetical protein